MTFTLKITNLQSDRPAPALRYFELLVPRQLVVPHNPPDQLPCFGSTVGVPPSNDELRGAAKALCYAGVDHHVGFDAYLSDYTLVDNNTNIPPGPSYIMFVTKYQIPDYLPAAQTSLWVLEFTDPRSIVAPILVEVPQHTL